MRSTFDRHVSDYRTAPMIGEMADQAESTETSSCESEMESEMEPELPIPGSVTGQTVVPSRPIRQRILPAKLKDDLVMASEELNVDLSSECE